VTPHTARGRKEQDEVIVQHFVANFAAFQGGAPMMDRVV